MLTDVAPAVRTITLTQRVPASPARVYKAFTNAMGLREWFCDQSQVDLRVGGVIFMAWNMGYFASGHFTALKPDEQVAFTWQGTGELAPTQVEVTLQKEGDGTLVTLTHSGMGEGETWDGISAQYEQNWKGALESLSYSFETGFDLRLMRRPMLGIFPGGLDDKTAEKLGLPTKEGIYLDSVVEKQGAAAAGLQRGDLMISLGGKALTDFPSLQAAAEQHRAGDTVEVIFYRGPEKKTVQMTLSRRPEPDVPTTPDGLAAAFRERQTALNTELDTMMQGVSEAEAAQAPATGEWSANEVLAHLIHSERWRQMVIWNVVGGEDNVPWQDNNAVQRAPILAAYQSNAELVAEFKRSAEGTAAALGSIPADFVGENRASFLRLAQFILTFEGHTTRHFQQMREAIEAVRK